MNTEKHWSAVFYFVQYHATMKMKTTVFGMLVLIYKVTRRHSAESKSYALTNTLFIYCYDISYTGLTVSGRPF